MCVCEFTVTTYDLPVDIKKNTDDIRLKAHKLCKKGQNNVWQNSTQKTTILATLVPLKTGINVCFGRVSWSCSISGTRSEVIKRRERHLILNSCWTPVYINVDAINETFQIEVKTNRTLLSVRSNCSWHYSTAGTFTRLDCIYE